MNKHRKKSKRAATTANITPNIIENIERFLFLEAAKQRITDKLRTVNWRTRLNSVEA